MTQAGVACFFGFGVHQAPGSVGSAGLRAKASGFRDACVLAPVGFLLAVPYFGSGYLMKLT